MNVGLPKEVFADCAIWDFAGQKEFYATHQTFLTNSAIYLLTVTFLISSPLTFPNGVTTNRNGN
jgi:GTPase SAR1 family protein